MRRWVYLAGLCVGASLLSLAFSAAYPTTSNYGPQGYVSVDGGSGADGYQIHRHDIVKRYGWPYVCLEHHCCFYYVCCPDNTRGATDAEKRKWVAERPARARGRASPAQVARWQASPLGDKWIRPPSMATALLANGVIYLLGWAAFSGLVWGLTLGLIAIRRRRQNREGLCTHCGYDLRASREFGRCPECGTPCETSP